MIVVVIVVVVVVVMGLEERHPHTHTHTHARTHTHTHTRTHAQLNIPGTDWMAPVTDVSDMFSRLGHMANQKIVHKEIERKSTLAELCMVYSNIHEISVQLIEFHKVGERHFV
jgi:hypothetical protein